MIYRVTDGLLHIENKSLEILSLGMIDVDGVVYRLCELMEVARSSYYAWRTRQPARRRRSAADAALTEQIRALHKTDPAMGSPRITASPGRGRPTGLRAGEP